MNFAVPVFSLHILASSEALVFILFHFIPAGHFLDTQVSLAPTPVSPSFCLSYFRSSILSASLSHHKASRRHCNVVADMVANMEMHMVANMEVDKVADMVANKKKYIKHEMF